MSSLSRSETPGNTPMAVPGTMTAGSAIQGPSNPSVHSKVAVLRNALVYLKSGAAPARRPTTPKRFGPTRFSPPLSMVWQIAHWRTNAAWPLAMSAAWPVLALSAKTTTAKTTTAKADRRILAVKVLASNRCCAPISALMSALISVSPPACLIMTLVPSEFVVGSAAKGQTDAADTHRSIAQRLGGHHAHQSCTLYDRRLGPPARLSGRARGAAGTA